MPKKKSNTQNDEELLKALEITDEDLKDLSDRIHQQEQNLTGREKADTKYNHSNVYIVDVMNNIDEYIIPELQEACKLLWSKNIFTFMCSNREDGGSAYIILGALSPENNEIFNQLMTKQPENFTIDEWRVNYFRLQIPDVTKMSEQEISSAFVKLASSLDLQDVQKVFYINSEDYLINCGCYDEISNPDYVEVTESMPTTASLEVLDEWFAKINCPKTIKVFNKNKMTKSFREYVCENGDENRTDFELKRVYEHPYFLKKHLEYVKAKEIEEKENDRSL